MYWDADRLDLSRIGIKPVQEQLSSYLEQYDLIRAAILRSRQSFYFRLTAGLDCFGYFINLID